MCEMERVICKRLNVMEVGNNISRFPVLVNVNDGGGGAKVCLGKVLDRVAKSQLKSLSLCGWKQYKPWFDEERLLKMYISEVAG
jgi:hypothetical protein